WSLCDSDPPASAASTSRPSPRACDPCTPAPPLSPSPILHHSPHNGSGGPEHFRRTCFAPQPRCAAPDHRLRTHLLHAATPAFLREPHAPPAACARESCRN